MFIYAASSDKSSQKWQAGQSRQRGRFYKNQTMLKFQQIEVCHWWMLLLYHVNTKSWYRIMFNQQVWIIPNYTQIEKTRGKKLSHFLRLNCVWTWFQTDFSAQILKTWLKKEWEGFAITVRVINVQRSKKFKDPLSQRSLCIYWLWFLSGVYVPCCTFSQPLLPNWMSWINVDLQRKRKQSMCDKPAALVWSISPFFFKTTTQLCTDSALLSRLMSVL